MSNIFDVDINSALRNKVSKLVSFSRYLFLVTIFLSPFILSINNKHSFMNLKFGLFCGVTILALILWSIHRLKKDNFRIYKNLLHGSILLVLLTGLLSSVFSDNPIVSIFGTSLGATNFFGLLILFVSALLISSLFNTEKSLFVLNMTMYISLVLSLAFNLLYILFDLPNFGFFVANSVNTYGKWTDLGLISVFTIVYSFIIIETQKENDWFKKFAWVGFALSSIVALIVNETIIWIFLAILSVIYIVYKIVTTKKNTEDFLNNNFPYTAITILLVSFAMILAGNLISNFTDSWLKISFTETRPGMVSTMQITKESMMKDPIFGVGLNRFERAWQLYKPNTIIQSNYWGSDFTFGYSYVTSMFVQTGLLGVLSWLLFLSLLFWNGHKLLFKRGATSISQKNNLLAVFSILFVLFVMIFHVPSLLLVIYMFVAIGIMLSSLEQNELLDYKEYSVMEKPKTGFLYIFSVIVLIIMSIYLAFMGSRIFASNLLLENANISLASGDLVATRNNIFNSLNLYATDLGFRSLSQYYQIELSNLLNTNNLNQQSTVDAFRDLLSGSIQATNNAIALDKNNYLNYLSLANIYEQLVLFNVEGSYDQSIDAYKKALAINPKNPGIHIDMARTAFEAKKNKEAKEFIVESSKLKPQFVNAAFLLSQIQVAEGNIPEAIKSVESAISIQPNNSNLYFQLGLLRYNTEDWNGAISSFERALVLDRNFANAKYFLGLSYVKVNRDEEAKIVFENLKETNPDNQEIIQILEKLNEGSALFENPEEEQPEDKKEPPVKE